MAGGIGERIDLPRLADVPILTEVAGQITPSRTKAEHRCAWQEMVERLLLDWIDAETTRTTVGS